MSNLHIQIQADYLNGRIRAIVLEGEFGNSWTNVKDICETKNPEILAEWIEETHPSSRIWTIIDNGVQELNICELTLGEEIQIVLNNALVD